MNKQSKNTDDFDRLLIAAIEDELTDERRRELFTRLQADPVQRGRYVDLMMLHSELEWGRANGAASQPQLLRTSGYKRGSLWKPMISLAAAMLIVAVIVFTVLRPPAPQIVQRPSPPVDKKDNAQVILSHIAALSASVDARWAKRGVIVDHAELNPGKLLLIEGSAEVTMMSGARIIIQAPCDIELLDSNSVRLAKGKLVARVPDRAKGFAVETPT
ncbi:MAG: hypothetical protein GY794_12135, partial [bacterium]|nr:hypothetical protein [bacterium]